MLNVEQIVAGYREQFDGCSLAALDRLVTWVAQIVWNLVAWKVHLLQRNLPGESFSGSLGGRDAYLDQILIHILKHLTFDLLIAPTVCHDDNVIVDSPMVKPVANSFPKAFRQPPISKMYHCKPLNVNKRFQSSLPPSCMTFTIDHDIAIMTIIVRKIHTRLRQWYLL